jgi:hypothetical protein
MATLIVRFKGADGSWKRCPAAYGGNGRVRSGFAVVNGNPQQVKQFTYQVRHCDHRKLKYTQAGKNAADAEATRKRIENEISATAVAENAGLKVEKPTERRTLARTAAEYIPTPNSAVPRRPRSRPGVFQRNSFGRSGKPTSTRLHVMTSSGFTARSGCAAALTGPWPTNINGSRPG